MFSAGETSGDLHGARLASATLNKRPDAQLIGFGGSQMREAGVKIFYDLADYSVMGFWEVAKNLRRIFDLLDKLTELMRMEQPDLLVLIDYPDFNWRLAKRAKALGVPVLSYIPPSAWAWRRGRAKKCAPLAKEFISIFPFETKPYEEAGANIHFVGNPLVDTVKMTMTKDEARAHFGVNERDYPILLLPGSRKQEIALLLPSMLEAAKKIKVEKPDARFFLPVALNMDTSVMHGMISRAGVDVELTHGHTYDIMGISEFAIATSGTVVLEAALLDLPSIVLYRLSPVSYALAWLFVKIKFFSLPNVLADEMIQPELLQGEVNPARILSEAEKFWKTPTHRASVIEKLHAACAKLGKPGATDRAAAIIIKAAETY